MRRDGPAPHGVCGFNHLHRSGPAGSEGSAGPTTCVRLVSCWHRRWFFLTGFGRDGVELFDRHWNMRATLVPLLARAAPALRPSMGNRASSSSRSVAVSAKGSGKKAGDAKGGGYGGEASVGEASGGQTTADAATAAELKDAGIKVILGSKSFTRKAILKEMGIEYTVAVADIIVTIIAPAPHSRTCQWHRPCPTTTSRPSLICRVMSIVRMKDLTVLLVMT